MLVRKDGFQAFKTASKTIQLGQARFKQYNKAEETFLHRDQTRNGTA